MLTDGQTITDSGTLTFATGDTMNFYSYYGASQIVVNGTMTATGDTFATLSGSGASIQVESGGELTATNSTFGVNEVSLNAGSTDNLQYVVIDTQLAINSGATINIASDDFTNGTVVASGNANATISLINNFWGTINPTQIAAKITDHANNPNLPIRDVRTFPERKRHGHLCLQCLGDLQPERPDGDAQRDRHQCGRSG